jgi:hypothetical protein
MGAAGKRASFAPHTGVNVSRLSVPRASRTLALNAAVDVRWQCRGRYESRSTSPSPSAHAIVRRNVSSTGV